MTAGRRPSSTGNRDRSTLKCFLLMTQSNRKIIKFIYIYINSVAFSPQTNYTNQATAACRRSLCQLLQIEDVAWSAQRIPTAVNLGCLDWYIVYIYIYIWSRDSAVGIATSYGVDGWGVGVRDSVGARFFSTPRRLNRLWGPHSFVSNGYRELCPQG
jgi:hypothetical protein